MNKVFRKIGLLILCSALVLAGDGFTLFGADVPAAGPASFPNLSAITPDLLCRNNPYNGRKRRCAAFARYGLYLLTGRKYLTYGSARRWARRAATLKAILPLALLRPGHLLFFRDQRRRINHVAIVLETDYEDSDGYAILFQDERGTHDWVDQEIRSYLGMVPVFGADPRKLETVRS